jgi:hypothetical protein
MTEEMDLWSKSVALSYALLRIALGLNICMHGIVRWAAGLRRGPSTASATGCQCSKQQSVLACFLVSRLGAP